MGGRSAKRRANQAAEQSRVESENMRQQSAILAKRTEDQARKAQKLLMRSLRARGSGYFETDFVPANTLGGGGTLG